MRTVDAPHDDAAFTPDLMFVILRTGTLLDLPAALRLYRTVREDGDVLQVEPGC
jgi:hypothetical protein